MPTPWASTWPVRSGATAPGKVPSSWSTRDTGAAYEPPGRPAAPSGPGYAGATQAVEGTAMGRRGRASIWGPLTAASLVAGCASDVVTPSRPRDTPLPPLPTVTTTTIPPTTLPPYYDVQRGDTLQGI